MYNIGFIGCGNMARAIIKGVLAAGLCAPEQIIASARTQETLDAVRAECGIATTLDNVQAAGARVVVLAVKPHLYESVLAQIAPHLDPETVVVSIAPGKTIAWLAQVSGAAKIARLMPNTPAAVGQGMTSVAFGEGCTPQDQRAVLDIVESFGAFEIIPESLFDAACAVAGCAPAYVYMFIEAMADAAVREGMPRASAYRFAAQAVKGSAAMVLESGQHPAVLKDAVCSPGGTTIEGVRVLEEKGMRSAVIEALCTAAAKAKGM